MTVDKDGRFSAGEAALYSYLLETQSMLGGLEDTKHLRRIGIIVTEEDRRAVEGMKICLRWTLWRIGCLLGGEE